MSFKVGDSENIPLEKSSVDIVINVESSHCYGSFSGFLKEVSRVLRPGGRFLFCDFRPSKEIKPLLSEFDSVGFIKENYKDITPNVVSALKRLSKYRKNEIHNKLPKFLHNILEAFAGVEGSSVFISFQNKTLTYISASFRKE